MIKNNWPKHLYALDVSRGIAALAVVFWHWQHFAYKNYLLPSDFTRESQPLFDLLRLFYEKGALGVQYFFILSGFIFFWLYSASIKNKQTSAWEFSVQRFSRLYPLHLITLTAVAILQFLYVSRENTYFIYQHNDAFHFFLNIGFASKWGFENGWSFNAPIWSVSIEILLYLIFFLTVLFIQAGRLFCLLVSVFAGIFSYVFSNSILSGLSMFFIGGFVFHLTTQISEKYDALKRPLYIMTIFSWFCVMVNYYTIDLSRIFLGTGTLGEIFLTGFPMYILFPLTILSLALIEIDRGPFLKPASWIGNITYSSYLLHFPLQLLFVLAVSFGLLNSNFYLNPLYLILYFAVLIPLSHLTFLKFERPMQRAIREKLTS